MAYGSDEMKKTVAAMRAKRKYQERTRGIGRTKARRTWRKLRGHAWLRDAKGRWCYDPNYVYPEDREENGQRDGDGDEDEDDFEEIKGANVDGYESDDLYSA